MFAKSSQLPALVETDTHHLDEARQALKEEQRRKDKQFWAYYQVRVDDKSIAQLPGIRKNMSLLEKKCVYFIFYRAINDLSTCLRIYYMLGLKFHIVQPCKHYTDLASRLEKKFHAQHSGA